MENERKNTQEEEKQLRRFRHMQEVLYELAGIEGNINLELTNAAEIFIADQYYVTEIPGEGDAVYLTTLGEHDGEVVSTTNLFPLSCLSRTVIAKILNAMHRAMLIEEIRSQPDY